MLWTHPNPDLVFIGGLSPRLGMGFWFRNQIEELWIGKRGTLSPSRIPKENVIEAKTAKHSQKPELFRDAVVEAAVKSFPMLVGRPEMLELFGTKLVDDWTVLGDEIDGKDIWQALRDVAAEVER